MTVNQKKVDRVAKALCHAAGTEVGKIKCCICESAYPEPCIWETFRREAVAAIAAMKGY